MVDHLNNPYDEYIPKNFSEDQKFRWIKSELDKKFS